MEVKATTATADLSLN